MGIARGNLKCVNNNFLISVNDRGTLILFYNTVITYIYAGVMIWVFYFIPLRSGKAVTTSRKDTYLDDPSLGISIINIDERANEYLAAR